MVYILLVCHGKTTYFQDCTKLKSSTHKFHNLNCEISHLNLLFRCVCVCVCRTKLIYIEHKSKAAACSPQTTHHRGLQETANIYTEHTPRTQFSSASTDGAQMKSVKNLAIYRKWSRVNGGAMRRTAPNLLLAQCVYMLAARTYHTPLTCVGLSHIPLDIYPANYMCRGLLDYIYMLTLSRVLWSRAMKCFLGKLVRKARVFPSFQERESEYSLMKQRASRGGLCG